MIGVTDDHGVVHGVSAICGVLPIAPLACYACLADPSKACARQQRDAVLRPKIQKVWDDHRKVYGVRKVWRQLCHEGEAGARFTVARLMAGMGLTVTANIHLTASRLRGIVRGKALKKTIPDISVQCPRGV
jgi:putative transposase